jgi:hypothetical protein
MTMCEVKRYPKFIHLDTPTEPCFSCVHHHISSYCIDPMPNPVVFFDCTIGGQPAGRIVMEVSKLSRVNFLIALCCR